MHPRRQLPKFLTADQLRSLLLTVAKQGNDRNFAIISLICSTGMRPASVAALKRTDYIASESCLIEPLKGSGFKRTPLFLNTILGGIP
jgi:integrase